MRIQVVQCNAETPKVTCSASAICVPLLVIFGFCRSLISGIISILYIALARGSFCAAPSVNVKTMLMTHNLEGCSYRLPAHVLVPDKKFLYLLEQVLF